MRLSDYVASFIADHCAPHVFWVSGGGGMYLNDSLAFHPGLTCVHHHHEQAAAMAAEAYARASSKIGVCHVTSGPGGTNAITGIAGAHIDSIPMLVISGQASTDRLSAGRALRQLGVQEIDIVSVVAPITKYAVTVTDPPSIRFHMEKALHFATTGRPGPVWIDLPINVTSAMIDPDQLTGFVPQPPVGPVGLEFVTTDVHARLRAAKRPVLLAGNGVRLANAVFQLRSLAREYGLPVVTTWGGIDLFDTDDPLYVGRCGLMGDRPANWAVQTADLILVVGSRLSVPVIGHAAHLFAPHAKLIMVDIDAAELLKPTLRVALPIQMDARDFVPALAQMAELLDIAPWRARCIAWKARYPVVLPEHRAEPDRVNSYAFVDALFARLPDDAVVVTDMGTAFTCTMQAANLKFGQRLWCSSGLAAMGYGLPAAIGAHYATGGPVICIAGDGGTMFNLQELQTIAHNKLPIAIFVLENLGYLAMKITQDAHFKRRAGCDPATGVSCPDFIAVAEAMEISAMDVDSMAALPRAIDHAMHSRGGPRLLVVRMPPDQALGPRAQTRIGPDGRFIPGSLNDMAPFLPHEELEAIMAEAVS